MWDGVISPTGCNWLHVLHVKAKILNGSHAKALHEISVIIFICIFPIAHSDIDLLFVLDIV